MPGAPRACGKARVGGRIRVAKGRTQRPPLLVVRHRERDPAVLAVTTIGVVGRGVVLVIAAAARHVTVDLKVEQRRRQEMDGCLNLSVVDVLALTGTLTFFERNEDGAEEEGPGDEV